MDSISNITSILSELGPSDNPFLAVAQVIEDRTAPRRTSGGVHSVLYVVIAVNVLHLFCNCIVLVCLGLQKRLWFFRKGPRGLITVNFLAWCQVLTGMASAMLAFDSAAQVLVDQGQHYENMRMFFIGARWIPLYLAIWAFLWGSLINAFIALRSIDNRPSSEWSEFRQRQDLCEVWALNIFMVIVPVAVIVVETVYSVLAFTDFSAATDLGRTVLTKLTLAAASYDPTTFSETVDLLPLLAPLPKMFASVEYVLSCLETAYLLWAVFTGVLLLTLTPATYAHMVLLRRVVRSEGTVTSGHGSETSIISSGDSTATFSALRRNHKMTIARSLALWFGTAVFLVLAVLTARRGFSEYIGGPQSSFVSFFIAGLLFGFSALGFNAHRATCLIRQMNADSTTPKASAKTPEPSSPEPVVFITSRAPATPYYQASGSQKAADAEEKGFFA